MELSVVIPVFNTDIAILKRCIESCKKIPVSHEIILVDDGSNIFSKKQYQDYLNSETVEIQYIEKENGGVSSARNMGLALAKGDYVTFADSDDYFTENIYDLELSGGV